MEPPGPAPRYSGMNTVACPLAAILVASLLLAACAHTTAKVSAAGSERDYSSNEEVRVGLPF